MPNNDKSLLFVVPEFVIGVPRFSTRDCIVYLAWNLRNSKFDVQYYHPNLLHISWRRHDTQYREERNPIVQMMKEAQNDSSNNQAKNAIVEASMPKSVIKKTTQQYMPPSKDNDYTKKVTFI
jgi:hypothetical protein